ncbi:SSPN protein, partial [Polyodon spathula]|nr:SSPN protein [Polyodon spathula]
MGTDEKSNPSLVPNNQSQAGKPGGEKSPDPAQEKEVCLVSLLGFYLYCVTYLPDEGTSIQFIAKLVYFLLCAIGLIICVLAVAFAGHHYSQINDFTCEPTGEMESCVCKLDPMDLITRTFEYRDVKDCSTVTTTLKLYFLLQVVLNLTLAIVCLIGCFVMWKHRYQVFFVGLQLNSANEHKQQNVQPI